MDHYILCQFSLDEMDALIERKFRKLFAEYREDGFISRAEAARILSVSKDTIKRKVKRGEITEYSGKHPRYKRSEIENRLDT